MIHGVARTLAISGSFFAGILW